MVMEARYVRRKELAQYISMSSLNKGRVVSQKKKNLIHQHSADSLTSIDGPIISDKTNTTRPLAAGETGQVSVFLKILLNF